MTATGRIFTTDIVSVWENMESHRSDGVPKTAIQWSVTPERLYRWPKYLHERYKKQFISQKTVCPAMM